MYFDGFPWKSIPVPENFELSFLEKWGHWFIITKHFTFTVDAISRLSWHFASCKYYKCQTELTATIFFNSPTAEQAFVTSYKECSQHDPSRRRILWCENCISNWYNLQLLQSFILMTASILANVVLDFIVTYIVNFPYNIKVNYD